MGTILRTFSPYTSNEVRFCTNSLWLVYAVLLTCRCRGSKRLKTTTVKKKEMINIRCIMSCPTMLGRLNGWWFKRRVNLTSSSCSIPKWVVNVLEMDAGCWKWVWRASDEWSEKKEVISENEKEKRRKARRKHTYNPRDVSDVSWAGRCCLITALFAAHVPSSSHGPVPILYA